MKDQPRRSVAERFADHAACTAAIGRAVREAVLGHARAGHPIAVWRDGRVVWLEPAEVLAIYSNEAAVARQNDAEVSADSGADDSCQPDLVLLTHNLET